MKILCLDFETKFDTKAGHTLKNKQTTEEYIRDPRFHIHGAAVGWYGEPPIWLDREEWEAWAKSFKWREHGCMAFHAQFEGLILWHYYGISPGFWFDPMAMARGMWGKHHAFSLDAISAYLGLEPKNIPYNLFDGKELFDLSSADYRLVTQGCCHDNWLMQQVFEYFARSFPREEYRVIDQTVRMFSEPVLELDINLLGEIWKQERAKTKENLETLAAAGVTLSDLRSDKKFKALLEAAGVEIEYKYSKTNKSKLIPAFAKTDEFLQALEEDPDEWVAALAQARLDSRSNITQTRSERLGYMATRGLAAVYLGYCTTRTTRWGGGDKVNWQNFPRSWRSDGTINRLRETARTQRGFACLRPDLSQIECRILNYNAGEWEIIEAFRQARDLYSELATKFYGHHVDKTMETERGFGKQMELSCGYGAGAFSIQRTARSGSYGPRLYLEIDECERARDVYRETHPNVKAYWREAGTVLEKLFEGSNYAWGPLRVADHKIWLPNGLPLVFDTLEWFVPDLEDGSPGDPSEGFWRVHSRPKVFKKIYGSALTAEVTQAQARVVLSQAMLRILDCCRGQWLKIALSTHDDLAIIVPERDAQDVAKVVIQELTRVPTWLPGIPLAAECVISDTLAKTDIQ